MQLNTSASSPLRRRLSSRLLVVDSTCRVLLFKFSHTKGALAGQEYWATPGGGLDAGESFTDAAVRELFEETGIHVTDVGLEVAQREATFQLPDGERVIADERYFLVRVDNQSIRRTQWSALEREVMAAHRWWSVSELQDTDEIVWPNGLARLLMDALSF